MREHSEVLKFAGRTMTKREVLIAREAYVTAVEDVTRAELDCELRFRESWTRRAAERYPLPKVEKPRVVRFNSHDQPRGYVLALTLHGKELCYRYEAHDHEKSRTDWHRVADRNTGPFERDLQMLLDGYADLLANPTELVEDDGGAA